MPRQVQATSRFVLENGRDVAPMSMRQQARRAGISHTAMVRLTTWLGLDVCEESRVVYGRSLRAPRNIFSDRHSPVGIDEQSAGCEIFHRGGG